YDLRTQLYSVLEKAGFYQEAVLREHCYYDGRYIDVVINAKFNRQLILRRVTSHDMETTYKWATDSTIRRYALNQTPISFHEHCTWFIKHMNNPECIYLIAEFNNQAIGSF